MTEQHVSLVHFDRGGAQYTPFINIHDDPYTFSRLVLAVSSFDECELGLDTSIRWRVECGLKVTGTIGVVDIERQYTEYCMLDVNPIAMHYDIRSRGLRIWRVRDDQTGEEVCIKDAWISEGDTLEYTLLERVRGVRGVVQMISYDICRTTTRACRNPPAYLEIRGALPATCHKRESRIVLEAYGDNIVYCGVEKQAIAAFRDAIAGEYLPCFASTIL
ncbi:hypothetical protein FA13DRAFT_1741386 [Coprinellus micaceus]|uniref:Fungal-type protein kinase domain-containing protein n=1 Tax=Coprinellus micaceus TaxID=71717 RepID=A0A4Y7SK75_COPMI|nr:hypothetical protein FA13DRAFT_1741386 [Coprinellus micaceus]